jgi:tricorn protease
MRTVTRTVFAGCALLCLVRASGGAVEGYISQPALYGDRVVFASENDLWTATLPADPAQPITAWRLTSSDGTEGWPVISPDGQTVAFAAEYDGNVDVYTMPIDGGPPTRLTFHPAEDTPLAWRPDGRTVLFASDRHDALGRSELFAVATSGGMPTRYAFGPCEQLAMSSTGSRFVFVRRNNARWVWRGYRGGTAPEIWQGDLNTGQFMRMTDHPANDLYPMWLQGRIFFLSDRDGDFNIHSMAPDGSDAQQHTTFAPDSNSPTAIEGYRVRWPSADAQRRGDRIVFCQGGQLALLDISSNTVMRPTVRLASDRVASRTRMEDPTATAVEYALLPDGDTLLVGSRGEVFAIDVKTGRARQLTRSSNAREHGVSPLNNEQIVMITDASGQEQIAAMPIDGSNQPGLLTEDRDVWLFRPVAAPGGQWVAFGDATQRLHLMNMQTLAVQPIARAEGGEIIDYRFSPDGHWLAYVMMGANDYAQIHLYSVRTDRSFAIDEGMYSNFEPRWDPSGRYLYFLSNRTFDPMQGTFDLEHIYLDTTGVYALVLDNDTPPPLKDLAEAAAFDLQAWAQGRGGDDAADADENADASQMALDTEDLAQRIYQLPIEPGNYQHLEAVRGGVIFLQRPNRGMLDDPWGEFGPHDGMNVLWHHDLVEGAARTLAEGVDDYTINAGKRIVVYPTSEGIRKLALDEPGGEPQPIDVTEVPMRVGVADEWLQIFDEAWRMQRDFYWDPNMTGVDWPAMRAKYRALVPLAGTRGELNDIIHDMIEELGNSHAYVWGGDTFDEAAGVSVGLLGADIAFDGQSFVFQRIIAGQSWNAASRSPLAASYLDIHDGDRLLSIDAQPLGPRDNVYNLLQGRAGDKVTLTVADADGGNRREVTIATMPGEQALRYQDWVEANRRFVAEKTDGRVGYIHIPDMGGEGLSMFSRMFYPQMRKRALIVDVRNNGGGFVSQMILRRLAATPLTYDQPRYGSTDTYPQRAVRGHMAVLIDQDAGSDGDIFPDGFRRLGLGPLIGMRTWGGVVGIRGDKPMADFGLSTQPEFAMWDETGWPIEGVGVEPDIEVDITPGDVMAGVDPQLEKAIEYLLRQLEEDPREMPEPPPYPVRFK